MIHARYYAISLISVYLSSLFLIPFFPIILVQLKYKMQRERKKIIAIVSDNFIPTMISVRLLEPKV